MPQKPSLPVYHSTVVLSDHFSISWKRLEEKKLHSYSFPNDKSKKKKIQTDSSESWNTMFSKYCMNSLFPLCFAMPEK